MLQIAAARPEVQNDNTPRAVLASKRLEAKVQHYVGCNRVVDGVVVVVAGSYSPQVLRLAAPPSWVLRLGR